MARITNLLNIIKSLQEEKPWISVLETGCIRNIEYQNGDGHSTRFIAELMRYSDTFISIDTDTKVCKGYLKSLGLSKKVNLIEADSREYLKSLKLLSFDLVYLDSANDDQVIFDEFMLIWKQIKNGGYLVIDDCYPESNEIIKCRMVIPWLKSNRIRYEVIDNQLIVKK